MSHWSDEKKYEVVTSYLALGKTPVVSALTKVPVDTIKQWRLQPWWKELVSQIQSETNQELDTKLSQIIDKSLDAVNDRVENGEFRLDPRTGKVTRVPASLKDVHRVAVDLLDKRGDVRAAPIKEKQELVTQDVLKKLAANFSDWVKLNLKQPRVVEGEVLAIHEERSEGLRDGVQEVPQPSRPEEEQGGTEQSTRVHGA